MSLRVFVSARAGGSAVSYMCGVLFYKFSIQTFMVGVKFNLCHVVSRPDGPDRPTLDLMREVE